MKTLVPINVVKSQDTYWIDDEVDKDPWYHLVTCLNPMMAPCTGHAIKSASGLMQPYDKMEDLDNDVWNL